MASFLFWSRASSDRDLREEVRDNVKAGIEEDSRGKGKVRARPAASAAWVWLNTRWEPRCEVRMAIRRMSVNKDKLGKAVLTRMSELEGGNAT